MRSLLVSVLILCTLANVDAQEIKLQGLNTDTLKLNLGDLSINLVRYSADKPNINFLVIHDSEDTGVEAAIEYINSYGGSIIDSQYGNTRNFKFCCEENSHEADPNAIYTRPGIFAGLNKYSIWKQRAANDLEITAKAILNFYQPDKHGYIFTLHNNLDSGFCIDSYLPGKELETTASAVYVNPEMDPDDLILVTRPEHYNYLKRENVNVILQSLDAPNDGSLSVYAMYMDIPYINIEVQHGHKAEQLRLIKIAADMLKHNEIVSRVKSWR